MLRIHCPQCKKSFFWTDDMPTQGKCVNPDCGWHYNVRAELKKNLSLPATEEKKAKPLLCPSCQGEINARISICPNCGYIVLGRTAVRKSAAFLYICLLLIILSLIFKYSG